MSLNRTDRHHPDGLRRRQPQADPASSLRSSRNSSRQDAMNVRFSFHGSLSSDVQEAIRRAIVDFESASGSAERRDIQWLIIRIDDGASSSVAATRLVDGRTFRSLSPEQLVADVQAAMQDLSG